jgi:SAM-dependent methyltransferase
MLNQVKRYLAHPLTHGLSLDDPKTTVLRRQIIRQKHFLYQIYLEWYGLIKNTLPATGQVLEIGSGAGFIKSLMPQVITSEMFEISDVDLVTDACNLPIPNASLDAIVMTDVLHHIPNVSQFFNEAIRCLRPNGKIVMIEPWHTPWSRFIYTYLHSEPFEPDAGWEIPSAGPLSGANGALPWILFRRDKALFESRYPNLHIKSITPLMPLSYMLSGGVSLRGSLPGWLYPVVRLFEKNSPEKKWAMFALIELEFTKSSGV